MEEPTQGVDFPAAGIETGGYPEQPVMATGTYRGRFSQQAAGIR